MLDGFAARLPARDAGLYPLVFPRISEPACIIAPVCQKPVRRRQATQKGGCARVVADLACGPAVMRSRIGRPSASATACSLVFMPPLVRPIRRPLWSPDPPFSTAGWSPCDVPSGRWRRSSPSSARSPRRPGHPSSGRRRPCRSTASTGCRAFSAGHTPWARHASAIHCD